MWLTRIETATWAGTTSSGGGSQCSSSLSAPSRSANTRGLLPVIDQKDPQRRHQGYGDRGVVLGHRPAQHVGEVVLLVAQLVDGRHLPAREEVLAEPGAGRPPPRPTGPPAPRRSPPTPRAAAHRTRGPSRASGSARSRRPRSPRATTGRPGPRPGPSPRLPAPPRPARCRRRRGRPRARPGRAALEGSAGPRTRRSRRSSVWCRTGADRSLPRSTAKRSSSRWRSSSSDIVRIRAAASSIARGSPSSRATTSSTRAGSRSALGRAAVARRTNRAAPSSVVSWSSSTTCSAAMFSGARLVVTTRRSRAVTSRNATRAATASTTCSQLSSTSSGGSGVELLRDAAADVGTLRDGVRTPRRDRVAHTEGGTDLGDHVVGRGDADQLDEVHPRLGGLPGEDVGDPGLADAAGADDRGQPAAAHRGSQSRQVGLATEQLLGVVPDAGADGLVGREQLAVQPLQRVGRVHAEAVAQVAAVVLVAGQRHRHARDDRLRAQQRFEQLGVVVRVVVRRAQVLQRLPLPPAPGQRQPEQPPGLERRTTSPGAHLGERPVGRLVVDGGQVQRLPREQSRPSPDRRTASSPPARCSSRPSSSASTSSCPIPSR